MVSRALSLLWRGRKRRQTGGGALPWTQELRLLYFQGRTGNSIDFVRYFGPILGPLLRQFFGNSNCTYTI